VNVNRCILLAFWLLPAAAAVARAADAPEKPANPADMTFFETKVRPLLAQRCYNCHSRQAKKLRGNLLLDSRDGCLKGGDTGPAVVPGDPDKSLLVQAIRYGNDDMAMPPKAKMPDAEIEVLVTWVKMGAPDPRNETAPVAAGRKIDIAAERRHWAYQPIGDPQPPAVRQAAWPANDIDRFVLAQMESKGLRPAGDADPAALVRRLYFDLAGVPPTPQQIDEYLNDAAPDRYEKLVDRLLASPQFGERWGRHWLDVARFGESLTLRGFVRPQAWRYRDYVIEAFNRDEPFDRFMQEQIAGDLLPADSIEQHRRQLVATSFLTLGNANLEEQDKKQLEMDMVDEQINAIGSAFLAQTIGCARCHDHKFDPIPTRDYYALAGILHSTQTLEHSNVSKWLNIPLPAEPSKEVLIAQHEAAVAAVQKELDEAKLAVASAAAGKPGEIVAASALPGVIVDDLQAKRVGSWRQSDSVKPYIGDGYLTDDGDRAEVKTLTFLPELPEAGKYEVRFAYTASANRASNVQVTVFSADGDKAITVDEKQVPTLEGHFISLGQHNFEKNGQGFVVVSNEGANGHVTADAVQFLPAGSSTSGAHSTAVAPPAAVTSPGKKAAKAKPVTTEKIKKLEAELKKVEADGPKREAIESVRESKQVADERVHVRGSMQTLGDPAPRGFLEVIALNHAPAVPRDQSGRLQLGQWLADPENPLPARVMANRAWHWLMGDGIVRTTDNFGTTGETPSNPALLDFLARRFEGGSQGSSGQAWSVKALVREIVLSHTYRLSTEAGPGAASADPENRWFSHMNRRRLDAECIRDSVLSVSGQLSAEAGGPTYPAALTSDFSYKRPDAKSDTRRSVYVPAFRNALPELFEVFDFADPSVCTGRRNVSTVAPQALFMLNNPWVVEQSRVAASRLLGEADCPDDRSRVIRAYRLTLGRAPSDAEMRTALDFVGQAGVDGKQEAWAALYHALFASIDFRYER
jgi:hypothetical protein